MEDIYGISLVGSVTLNTPQTITAQKWFKLPIYTDSIYSYSPDGQGGNEPDDERYRLIKFFTENSE